MKITMPMSRPRAPEKKAFVPTNVTAARAAVRISDTSPNINILPGKVTNLPSFCSMKDLQRSRMLQAALKSGMVVEAKENSIL